MRSWDNLLNDDRFKPTEKLEDDLRLEFERDYDRIVYSSGFRRLQDKAQVFPLEQHDFVRTRLTHSLEVSCLARSLGVDVARNLYKMGATKENFDSKFGNILASIALVHDLGNPPFGHFGEKSISRWFDNYFNEKHNKHIINKKEKNDFISFEGNAQTFRILTKLQFLRDLHGLNLTYATLASLMKYPRNSSEVKKTKGVSFKKFGYFISEEETFKTVAEKTSLNGFRHPLAFLLEAADDIAYAAADVEDALKKGVLKWEELIAILSAELASSEKDKKRLEKIINRHKEFKDNNFPESELNAMQLLRIDLQGRMMRACVKVFVDNIEQILEGSFDESLIEKSEAANIYNVLVNKIGVEHIYVSERILTLEVVGNKVIDSLLSMFVEAVRSNDYLDKRTLDGKLFSMFSPTFVHIFNTTTKTMYNRLQLVTDFISGMTDSYALELYQKLNGVRVI